jgi:hypothetical protein
MLKMPQKHAPGHGVRVLGFSTERFEEDPRKNPWLRLILFLSRTMPWMFTFRGLVAGGARVCVT